jgi:hypothetical protein
MTQSSSKLSPDFAIAKEEARDALFATSAALFDSSQGLSLVVKAVTFIVHFPFSYIDRLLILFTFLVSLGQPS